MEQTSFITSKCKTQSGKKKNLLKFADAQYRRFIKQGMTLRSLNKGPEGVSHFLSMITLGYRFRKLITSLTVPIKSHLCLTCQKKASFMIFSKNCC